jgi:hypothetical protein
VIPDHQTAVDFLNYEAIAETAIELLKDNRKRALSIGIHGDWGAGVAAAGVSIRALYLDERRRALERLARHLLKSIPEARRPG